MWWTVLIINKCCNIFSPIRIAYFLSYAIWSLLGGLFQCLFNYFRTSWSWTFEAYLQVSRISLLYKNTTPNSKPSLTNIYNYFSEFCSCWNEFSAENEIENFQDHRLSYDSNRISTFLCAGVQQFYPNGNSPHVRWQISANRFQEHHHELFKNITHRSTPDKSKMIIVIAI